MGKDRMQNASAEDDLVAGQERSRDAGHLPQRRQSRCGWVIIPVGVLLAGYIFYGIESVPPAWGDEQDLLSNDYRFVTYGQRGERIIISENYNQRLRQKLPFPWASWLRSLYHRAVGLTCYSSRVFTALLILSCILVTAVVCPLRSGLSRRQVLILLLITGLSPPLYYAARTVRFEQEILFLAVISMFVLPLFLSQSRPRYLKGTLWLASGALSGWAAVSHPGGCVFLLAQFLSLLWYRKAWKEADGLTSPKRVPIWLLGVAIPVSAVLICVVSDWHNWSHFLQDTNHRFVLVRQSLVDWWAPQWPCSIGSKPPLLAASLYAFGLSATSPYMLQYTHAPLVKILFAVQAVFLLIASCWHLIRPCRARDLAFRSVLTLAVGFILFHFFYAYKASPNYTYYPYLGLLVPLGFSWTAIELRPREPRRNRHLWQVLRLIPLGIVGLAVVLYLHFAFSQTRWIYRESRAKNLASFDSKLDAVGQMGERLGWLERQVPVYVDNLSWRASGPRWKSLFELLLAETVPLPEPSDHVAFNAHLADSFFAYPGFGSKQLTLEQRLQRITRLLEGRVLVGVLFDTTSEYYFYAPRGSATGQAIVVGQILSDGRTIWNHTKRPSSSLITTPHGFAYENLPRGRYLLWIRGATLTKARVRLTVRAGRSAEMISKSELALGNIHVSSAKAVLVTLTEDDSAVSLELEGESREDLRHLTVSLEALSD